MTLIWALTNTTALLRTGKNLANTKGTAPAVPFAFRADLSTFRRSYPAPPPFPGGLPGKSLSLNFTSRHLGGV